MKKFLQEFGVSVAASMFVTFIFYLIATVQTDILIPPNAVVAFDSETCPQGWSPLSILQDKFVIGAGGEKKLNTSAGNAVVTLTESNMPPHSHSAVKSVQLSQDDKRRNGAAPWTSGGEGDVVQTSITGGVGAGPDRKAEPFNNLPPWYALTYCRKAR